MSSTEVTCPFCGEPAELSVDVDEGEPGDYEFVQDCDVCCRPWAVHVTVGADGELAISVDRS